MYSEEETELRDLIIQNLEGCGFLNKIKAELRAGVFLALEEDGNLRSKIPLLNQKLDDFVSTSEGKLMLSLVREFLEYFNLNFTLSVLDPETSVSTPCMNRPELCNYLKVNSDHEGPVISFLLKTEVEKYKLNQFSKPNDKCNEIINNYAKSILKETANSEKNDMDEIRKEQLFNFNNLESGRYTIKNNSEESAEINSNVSMEGDSELHDNTVSEKGILDIKSNDNVDTNANDVIFKDLKATSSEHDPFFDEPVPSEKPSFFSFSDALKEKPESKFNSNIKNDFNDYKKSSLSSLRDLPSLTASNEWTFSRDIKSTLSSLDSLKSVSSSETSNEETVNLDTKENLQKKDSDIAESNDSSEKQNSESIEEEIDDFSTGIDDLLNSSLSLADDATTDQTVSQVSVVEGVDHVEPCNS